jgi:hypothetical protein
MYKIGDYLRVKLKDESIAIVKVHTEEVLIVKTLDGRLLFEHEFEIVEPLTVEEVSDLLTQGR